MHLMAIHILQMALHGNVKQFSCQGECVFFFNYAHSCNLNYQGVHGLSLVPQPHYIYWVGGIYNYIHNMQASSQEVWREQSINRTAGGGGGGGWGGGGGGD